jgi:serine/threonine-protein kinase RsbW
MEQVDPPIRIRMKFRSGPLAVRAALAHILSELDPLRLGADNLGTVEIVLAEALNNIVEHAYPEGDPAGAIDISCRAGPDGLHVRIVDNGRAMPGGQLPYGRETDLTQDLLDLPEGGFGWMLILQLAKDVSYQRGENRNILDLRLPVCPTA